MLRSLVVYVTDIVFVGFLQDAVKFYWLRASLLQTQIERTVELITYFGEVCEVIC
jgi:hypothetical protein